MVGVIVVVVVVAVVIMMVTIAIITAMAMVRMIESKTRGTTVAKGEGRDLTAGSHI